MMVSDEKLSHAARGSIFEHGSDIIPKCHHIRTTGSDITELYEMAGIRWKI